MKKTSLLSLNKELGEFAQSFDIHFAEHLVSLYSSEQLKHLVHQLGLAAKSTSGLLDKLIKIQSAFLNNKQSGGFNAGTHSFGFTPAVSEFHSLKQLPLNAIHLPKKVDFLTQHNLHVKDQANRGTCAAHAASNMMEFKLASHVPHSPAYIYYWAKQIDGNQHEGTSLHSVLEALKYGSCEERFSPYAHLLEQADDFAPSPIAKSIAKKNAITDWVVMPPSSNLIDHCKLLLSGGIGSQQRALIVGVKVFKEQMSNLYSDLTGEWSLPLDDNDSSDYYLHAMALIGIHDDERYASGGRCLLMQSYGKKYAEENDFNHYSTGIVSCSYEYLQRYCVAVGTFLLEGEKDTYFESVSAPKQSNSACDESKVFAKSKQIDKPEYAFKPFCNNHYGLFGATGSGKTTRAVEIVRSLAEMQPELCMHIIDPHIEWESKLKDVNPTVIDIEQTGLPFPFIEYLRGNAPDIKVRSLSNDLQAASHNWGKDQIPELNKVLEIAIAQGLTDNLELKAFLEDNLDKKLINHIADFTLLLRSSSRIELSKPGIFIHDLSAFDEIGPSRALYLLSLLRYCKNTQFQDNSMPMILFLDEAELILNNRSENSLKRFFQESRKSNLAAVWASQVRPKQAWFNENLSGFEELELDNTTELVPMIDYKAMQTSSFATPSKPGMLQKVVNLL